jgi:hypothetical protein
MLRRHGLNVRKRGETVALIAEQKARERGRLAESEEILQRELQFRAGEAAQHAGPHVLGRAAATQRGGGLALRPGGAGRGARDRYSGERTTRSLGGVDGARTAEKTTGEQ